MDAEVAAEVEVVSLSLSIFCLRSRSRRSPLHGHTYVSRRHVMRALMTSTQSILF